MRAVGAREFAIRVAFYSLICKWIRIGGRR